MITRESSLISLQKQVAMATAEINFIKQILIILNGYSTHIPYFGVIKEAFEPCLKTINECIEKYNELNKPTYYLGYIPTHLIKSASPQDIEEIKVTFELLATSREALSGIYHNQVLPMLSKSLTSLCDELRTELFKLKEEAMDYKKNVAIMEQHFYNGTYPILPINEALFFNAKKLHTNKKLVEKYNVRKIINEMLLSIPNITDLENGFIPCQAATFNRIRGLGKNEKTIAEDMKQLDDVMQNYKNELAKIRESICNAFSNVTSSTFRSTLNEISNRIEEVKPLANFPKEPDREETLQIISKDSAKPRLADVDPQQLEYLRAQAKKYFVR